MSTRNDETPLTAAELRAAARSHKQAARERLAGLRVKLRAALATKKARMRELVEECKRERLAVRGAIFAMRQSALDRLRDEVKAARQTARDQRDARLVEVRSTSGAAIAAARAALSAHRQHEAEQTRITTQERRRKADIDKLHAQTLAGGALHGPKLEKLRPLLEHARTVPTLPGESKVEALWRYARSHPEEMHAILEPKAEKEIAKTKTEIAEVVKSARAPSAFELKRAARAERMRTRAGRLRAEAEGAFKREDAIAGMIPMGQPILVGHHSEKRHRRDLARMDSLMRKGLTLSKEAETLERRAAFAEKNTAVSSDDPDAVPKLRAKLEGLEQGRAKMKAANAAIRQGGDVVARLVGLGFSEGSGNQLLQKDFAGRVGFPDYKFKNTASEEKRLKDRIRQLETRAASPTRPPERVGDSTITEAENRVRITFPSKPPEEMRRALKSAGFRWSPTAGAWQRFAGAGAWDEARRILAKHGGAAPVPALAIASTTATPPPQG
jgi:hypothetical protein